MVLNYIWVFFFLIAFVVALIKLIFFADYTIFPTLVNAIFDMAKTGFEISLGLTGVLTLFLGIMRIGEDGGIVKIFSRLVSPLFSRLMPDIPKNHPAHGSIIMNLTANLLGLDNAATPMGLKAMKEMQEINPDKSSASNSQIMFLVLNTSGLTLIPISIMVYRAQMGAADPTDIFIPILFATYFSTLVGLVTVGIKQRLKLYHSVVLTYLGGITLFIVGTIILMSNLSKEQISVVSKMISNFILFTLIISFILLAFIRKVNVYESFIQGAKNGFNIAIKIIPYLVAILVAIGVFRASGSMDLLVMGMREFILLLGINADFIEALPTALMKPLSGSGARGMMIETMGHYGADSFVGRLASTVQGATDTTFYIVALYFGSVGIKKTRYAVTYGLIADLAGIIAAILIGYMFFY